MNLVGMFITNDKGRIALWYSDGDLCAVIEENLGLGIDAEKVGKFFCNCANDANELCIGIDNDRS